MEYPIRRWAAVGYAVREVRRDAGLTQEVLAERAGVSRGWLVRFEQGLDNPEATSMARVLRALDLEVVLRPTVRTPEQAADEDYLRELLGDD